MINLDRYVGSCNAINGFYNKVCVPNKTEGLILSVFNMISGKNELKTLTKSISCECKCKFDGRKCKSNQKGIKINVSASLKILTDIVCGKNIMRKMQSVKQLTSIFYLTLF